jgi:gluconate 2-dehydrogenase gamma chain
MTSSRCVKRESFPRGTIVHSSLITRRTAIKSAVALVGGSIATAQLNPLIRSVAAMEEGAAPGFLDSNQYSMLEKIVDLIIPETDTPGAKSAGVHRFIDFMLADWASPQTRNSYVEGLRSIDQRAQATNSAGFSASSPAQQFALLESLDAAAETDDTGESFFKGLKALVLFGYYSSEEGASVELKYDRLPGPYRDCVPFDEIGRSWST